MQTKFSDKELIDINKQQLFSLGEKIRSGQSTLPEIGDLLPCNVLITDLQTATTTYMNQRGRHMLKCTLQELVHLGPAYYERFFVPEEVAAIMPLCGQMYERQDNGYSFQFSQRVRANGDKQYKWYFGSTKLLYAPGETVSTQMMIMVNEVNSLGAIAKKVNSILEEKEWLQKNFRKFCLLTKREKEIITLLMAGNTSAQIAELLAVSRLTIITHRRNIGNKLECKTFAELYKFASSFGLNP